MTSELTRQILLALHLVGLALGMGAASVSDYSFFRTLRMSDRITPETVSWMRSFSKLVWAGIGLLAVSGAGLFLQDTDRFLESPGFLAKMLLVLVLVINGLFLNFYTTARLTTFNFSEKYKESDAAWWSRKLSFVFGAISMVTWYAILAIATLKSVIHLSIPGYILIYLAVVTTAVSGSLVLEKLLGYYLKPKPLPDDPNKRTISSLVGTNPKEIIKTFSTDSVPAPQQENIVRQPEPVSVAPENSVPQAMMASAEPLPAIPLPEPTFVQTLVPEPTKDVGQTSQELNQQA